MAEQYDKGRKESPAERAREEFFSEAQELVDGLSRDLVALDALCRSGGTDAELVNDVFRAVHTLKGLSGLFGAAMMSGLSHELENLLDDLRLGRLELSLDVLDLLFRSVDLYARILSSVRGDGVEPVDEVKELLGALSHVSENKAGSVINAFSNFDLDPGVLSVLTEYEEHRLRTNIQNGFYLYRLKVQFSLTTIDTSLDDLKSKTRPHGEIITYLPTGDGADADFVELEVLVASRESLEVLSDAVAGPNVVVERVARRDGASQPKQGLERAESGTSRPGAMPGPEPMPPWPHGQRPAVTLAIGLERDGYQKPAAVSARHTSAPPALRAGDGDSAIGDKSLTARDTPSHRVPKSGIPGRHDTSLRSVSQTVRVDIRKLDYLMSIVGELAIVRGAVARLADRARRHPELKALAPEIHRVHRSFERHLAQMQEGVLEVRMVPLGQMFDKVSRIVRQISREYDKPVNLVITGAETELDKLIVEELSDPLMHMIRNALDHGIEARDVRMNVGKSVVGTVVLNAFQKGNQVVLEVEDDGKGMSPKAIAEAAVRRGLIEESDARDLSTKEALSLVFLPGFSTRDGVTELSGRGVGMDIVKTNISKLGGSVDVASEIGIGTKMTITLPITLAIINVLMVDVAGRVMCVPLVNVEEAIVFDETAVRTFEGREMITQREQTLPLLRLSRLFQRHTSLSDERGPIAMTREFEPEGQESARLAIKASPAGLAKKYCVVACAGDRRVGFVVDRVIGQQDIVIKALGRSLRNVRGIAGATELGDQRVGLVLDASSLIQEVLSGTLEDSVDRSRRLTSEAKERNDASGWQGRQLQ